MHENVAEIIPVARKGERRLQIGDEFRNLSSGLSSTGGTWKAGLEDVPS